MGNSNRPVDERRDQLLVVPRIMSIKKVALYLFSFPFPYLSLLSQIKEHMSGPNCSFP